MKKILYLAAASLLLLAACTKNDVQPVAGQNEITFLTANYATKAGITGTVFPTTEKFGAYAWTDNTIGAYFMDNETVSFVAADNAWKPSTTYYWPKNSKVDFVCFYPQPTAGLTVAANKLTYTGYDVSASQKDLMYADKAVGYDGNTDEISDGTNTYTGVPVIFRHALAKLKIDLALTYNHKKEADGTVTDWEVTLNSFKLVGVYKAGDCVLNLSDASATGVVAWTKPTDAAGNHVWTNDGTLLAATERVAAKKALVPGTDYNMVPETFVLPQTLAAGQQKIQLNVTIKTKRNGADFLSETFDITSDLVLASLPAWEMNNVINYRISMSPTKGNGNGGNPIDPNNPVDPNNPDLRDVVISFDPAVDGWEGVNVVTQLAI